MSMRLAILCPGQGAQHAAMFDLLNEDAQAAQFLAQCDLAGLLQAPLQQVLADPAQLYANRNAQPLIVAAQLAAWQALREPLAALAGTPAVVAGYSVGELSAQAIAGVIPASATVALAAQRAACMTQAASAQPAQGLMAVGGIALASAQSTLERHGAHVAIITGDDTLIAGGSDTALQAAAVELAAMGARSSALPVGLASHTPLMQAAVAPLAASLASMVRHDPEFTLLAGVTGQAVADARQARELLLRQLTEPIQWAACMDACVERGVTVALELGPGAALSRMLRERHPQLQCRSLADFRSLAGALAWLRRQLD
ncbi:acyltransferase domain-containing protein [Herbaspirillum sp. AP02]|uniref:ACP S-malonyltransferase n=1 Tax=unclassified Herbaspirillum TaxID=2624150 RepID=UPI0015DAA35B|nr:MULTISPECIES: acyltransferase domain-containing protein [unclassified Herbaspirillum]MBG7619918.1 acyltransferase domain-containing protein [Herbaspirillum sp. AP02]NZD69018.1 acyltransferase domain-containing protein [Herbaspirillum sp. AP21]